MPGAVSHYRLARRNRGNAKKKRKKKYRRRPIAPRARVTGTSGMTRIVSADVDVGCCQSPPPSSPLPRQITKKKYRRRSIAPRARVDWNEGEDSEDFLQQKQCGQRRAAGRSTGPVDTEPAAKFLSVRQELSPLGSASSPAPDAARWRRGPPAGRAGGAGGDDATRRSSHSRFSKRATLRP